MHLARPRLAAALCLSMLAVFSAGAEAQCANPVTTTLTAGLDDDFAPPTEPASPSAPLAAFLGGTTPVFDQTAGNRGFGHTFTGLPPGVMAAQLTVRLRALGGGSDNDDLALEYIGSGRFGWTTRIATLTGMTWKTAGQEAEVTIDLASVDSYPFSLLSALSNGSLDVYVEDDTAVDFLTLEVTSCPPPATSACLVPPSGLVAWWPFDDPNGLVVYDLAGHHDAKIDRPLAVAGRGPFFDGTEEVQVPDQPDLPSLNFGAAPGGDFSIEVALANVLHADGAVTLVDKREFPPFPQAPVGYALFLYNGRLALQLAEGGTLFFDPPTDPGFTNYISSIIADDVNHVVAVTVERGKPDGIHFYLDGQEKERRDPTPRGGSLVNDAPLRIGTGLNGFVGGVRIFDRALSPAEVEMLYDSFQGLGSDQCRSALSIPANLSMCPGDSELKFSLEICNSDPLHPRQYDLTLGDPASECFPGAGVGGGPASFTLGPTDQNPLLVAARKCRQVDVSAARPVNFQADLFEPMRCFQATADDSADGEKLTATTSIWAVDACATPVLPIYWEIAGEVTTLFSIRNDTAAATTIPWKIQAKPAASGAVAVSLDGLPPGDVVTGQVTVPAHATAEVPVQAALLDFQPFAAQEVQLLDTRSDVVLASAGIRSFAAGCSPGPTTLCLEGGRFEVSVAWKDFAGNTGLGQAVPLTAAAGYFWFFGPDNVELVLKVLDGRPLNSRFWVFYGALSTVEYVVTVTDTETGNNRTFVNLAGNLASVADTSALPGGTPPVSSAAGPAPVDLARVAAKASPDGTCSPFGTALCLGGGRFRAEVEWQDFLGNTGAGQAVSLTDDAGYFWFFSPENVELALKVLDGSPADPHRWVFSGGMSSVQYRITVTDTETGRVRTYLNPRGKVGSFVDTSAFPI